MQAMNAHSSPITLAGSTRAPVALPSVNPQRLQHLPASQRSQHAQTRRRQALLLTRATPDEDVEIEKMKQAATTPDKVLENEGVSIGIKIAVISVFVGVSIGLAKVAEPIIQTTIARFPIAG